VAQIHAEIGVLAEFTPVTSTTIFGGVAQGPQVRALRAGPRHHRRLPGAPARPLRPGAVRLSGIEVLVLDEADHMFDLGFLPSIKRIVAALPKKRQNMCFSATMPDEIRHLADRILVKPEVVELNHSAPAATIEHALYPVPTPRSSTCSSTSWPRRASPRPSSSCARSTARSALAQRLDKAGHAAVALQGNMSQSQREKAMAGFRSGKYDVLVATDIAARGIDVADVSHVINFDVPARPTPTRTASAAPAARRRTARPARS
jgi:ATP-dependent RNA helicase RhlE